MAMVSQRALLSITLAATFMLGMTGCQAVQQTMNKWFGPKTEDAASLSQPEKEKRAQALFDEGVVASNAGNLDQAIEKYKGVLELFPLHVAANTNLGLAYAKQEKWPEAQQAFDTALAAEPENVDANTNQAWVLAEQANWPKALERGLVAKRLAPENPYLHNTLGWIYTATEQPADAIASYQKAVELKPDLNAAWAALAKLQCQQGNLPQAQAALTHLPAGSPEMTEATGVVSGGCKKGS